jgi:hypothetical protein
MTKTLRILLVGAALAGTALPALARGDGGGGAGGPGGDGGTSAAWDATIPGIQVPAPRTPGATVPPQRQVTELRDETCGFVRGQRVCRPR